MRGPPRPGEVAISNWLVTDRLYADGSMISLVQPGPWATPTEPHVAEMITWVGDVLPCDKLYIPFEDPADWPELAPSVVEAYNRPQRAIVQQHAATMTAFTPWLSDVYAKAEEAGARMALVRAQRANPGQPVSIRYGSIEMGSVPPPDRRAP